jgi:phasin family protein
MLMDYMTIPGQVVEVQKAQAAAMDSLRETLLGVLEKTFKLNEAAAKAIFDDGIEATQALVSAKNAQQALQLWNGVPAWTLEKVSAYSQNAYRIFSGAGADVLKLVEPLAQTNRQMSEFVESEIEKGPFSRTPAVLLFKGMMMASRTLIEGEFKSAKQAVEWGGSGFATLANAAAAMSSVRAPDEVKVATDQAVTA